MTSLIISILLDNQNQQNFSKIYVNHVKQVNKTYQPCNDKSKREKLLVNRIIYIEIIIKQLHSMCTPVPYCFLRVFECMKMLGWIVPPYQVSYCCFIEEGGKCYFLLLAESLWFFFIFILKNFNCHLYFRVMWKY